MKHDACPACGWRPKEAISTFVDRAAAEAGVTREVILGASRARRVTFPRQKAMADAYDAGWSMPVIGKHFGDRDHTTVLHAVKKRRAGEI